jgi:hypothetical protein
MSTLAPQDRVGSLHDNADVYREGREALDRISTRDWSDWQKVGAALAAGRTEAMRSANTNRPKGKRYNQAFGIVLKREQLDRLDSATRNQLLRIEQNLSAIEEWREKLDAAQRLRWNHPSAIWRNWQRTVKGTGKHKQSNEGEIIAAITTLVRQMRERGFTNAQLDDLLAAKPSFTSNDLMELIAQLEQLAAAWQEHAKRNMMIEETSR